MPSEESLRPGFLYLLVIQDELTLHLQNLPSLLKFSHSIEDFLNTYIEKKSFQMTIDALTLVLALVEIQVVRRSRLSEIHPVAFTHRRGALTHRLQPQELTPAVPQHTGHPGLKRCHHKGKVIPVIRKLLKNLFCIFSQAPPSME